MDDQFISWIQSYLRDVNEVLTALKFLVGKEVEEGKSWYANIPANGAFPESGISKLHRHGVGMWAYYHGRFVDFDFSKVELPREDDQPFICIDIGFLANYIKSFGVTGDYTEYSFVESELDKLVKKELAEKIGYQYYFVQDLYPKG